MEKAPEAIFRMTKPYFSEARKRVFWCLIFFAVVFFTSFMFSRSLMRFFLEIFKLDDVQIVTTSPFQSFGLAINVAVSIAIILTFPLFIYNIFSFFSPALTKNEKRGFFKMIFSSVILFISGFAFGFYILSYVMKMLAEYNTRMGLTNMWDIGTFSTQIFLTSAIMGIIFQFPIILTVAVRTGVIGLDTLKKKRAWAVVAAFALTALLPPTDGLSLIIMALPLILIYEATLLYNRQKIAK